MKKILSKIILIFLFGLLIIPNSKANETASLSKTEWEAGEKITIHGNDFGDSPGLYGYICFNSDNFCYGPDSNGIISWNNSAIVFTIPNFIDDVMGNLMVYATAIQQECISGSYCYNKTIGKNVAILSYKIKPVIKEINDGKYVLKSAAPGQNIYIYGSNFGKDYGTVTFTNGFNTVGCKILSWSANLIQVTVPELKYDMTSLTIGTTAGKGINGLSVSYEFRILGSVSDDNIAFLQEYLRNAKIDRSWNTIEPKTEIIVAIIDDGIYLDHADLQDKIWKNTKEIFNNNKDDDGNGYIDDYQGYNFITNNNIISEGQHGTLVSGIIAAIRNNNIGIAGIAEKAKIMPLVTCDQNGCPLEAIVQAIRYATDNGAKVINISLGFKEYLKELDDSIQYAFNKGVAIVVAAGNDGKDLDKIPLSPVCNDGGNNLVFGVGASTADNQQIASFSNYGKCVDIYAQGKDVLSTVAPQLYDPYNIKYDLYKMEDGTSFAAPIVSGLMAYILSAYPEMDIPTLYNFLIKNNTNNTLDAFKVVVDIKKNYDAEYNSKIHEREMQRKEAEYQKKKAEEKKLINKEVQKRITPVEKEQTEASCDKNSKFNETLKKCVPIKLSRNQKKLIQYEKLYAKKCSTDKSKKDSYCKRLDKKIKDKEEIKN